MKINEKGTPNKTQKQDKTKKRLFLVRDRFGENGLNGTSFLRLLRPFIEFPSLWPRNKPLKTIGYDYAQIIGVWSVRRY